ncbi:hypothetical protein [Kibdelosporangium banguiense]|uniref:hypothetical protein n=1 Tax=Kibdelosporangium banguiense TaxID=1365924 RepID=UPI00355824C9
MKVPISTAIPELDAIRPGALPPGLDVDLWRRRHSLHDHKPVAVAAEAVHQRM